MATNLSAPIERRLETIRGAARLTSPSVRRLAAFAQHTDCRLATLAFATGVDLDRLLKKTRFEGQFGQSPFAFRRGIAFENSLRENNYEPTLQLLRAELKDPLAGAPPVNLRNRYPATREGMPLRLRDTQAILKRIVEGDPAAPNLIDGAVLRGSVGGVEAYFEADALAARTGREVRVAEVKSFPKVDDRIDADKLGAALDQVAIYILLTRQEVERLGGDPARLVSELALLLTPKNVGLRPTLSVKAVGPRIARAEKVLAAVPRVEDVAASVPAGLSFGPVADTDADEGRRLDALHRLADRVGTAYKPACLANCGNARFCRERAHCSGSPQLLGIGMARLMPGINSLARAEELTRGTAPAPGERPAAELLAVAGRLYDRLSGPAPRPGAGTPQRRPA
jgi:hypothetical protein